MKPALIVTVVFLSLVALLHLLRLLFGIGVTVNGVVVPMWVSLFGCLGPAALAVWLWLEQRPSSESVT
ncbi:MAG: hypothetical protein HKM89_14600 [Gemmatimonadales bacterium]|nr:hypothetical protein [Gemmatimonadales bacterium]